MTDKGKEIKNVYDMFVSKGMVVGYRTKNREEYALVHTQKQSVFGNIGQQKSMLLYVLFSGISSLKEFLQP